VLKRSLLAVAGLAAAFVATSWWALESGGVARIHTRMADGGVRSTHVWFVEPDGELWLEAGTPDNAWFLDVREDPSVSLEVEGRALRYTAEPLEDASSHARIRALIRDKDGLRDRWVGLFVDTSRSIAVRLVPE
jgi:hypothetical protein